jgi:uncharacterized membrane protein YfhO
VIECTVTAGGPGWLRVIESFDPGWSATRNGQAVAIHPALNALLAVPIPTAGTHQITFTYRTPGAAAGIVVSAISAALLIATAVVGFRRPRLTSTAPPGSRDPGRSPA